jgi:hypothetical protein
VSAGAYGITAVDPETPGALVCGECGKAWADDITPAGRCPWEWDHPSDETGCEGPYRATVLQIEDRAVPAIVDSAGHYVGFMTEDGNAELADAMNQKRNVLPLLWKWRAIPNPG